MDSLEGNETIRDYYKRRKYKNRIILNFILGFIILYSGAWLYLKNSYTYSIEIGNIYKSEGGYNEEVVEQALNYLQRNASRGGGEWTFNEKYTMFTFVTDSDPELFYAEINSIMNEIDEGNTFGDYTFGWEEFVQEFENETLAPVRAILDKDDEFLDYRLALLDPIDTDEAFYLTNVSYDVPVASYDFQDEYYVMRNNLLNFGSDKENLSLLMFVLPFIFLGTLIFYYNKE